MSTLSREDFMASQRTMDPNLVSESIIDLLGSNGGFSGMSVSFNLLEQLVSKLEIGKDINQPVGQIDFTPMDKKMVDLFFLNLNLLFDRLFYLAKHNVFPDKTLSDLIIFLIKDIYSKEYEFKPTEEINWKEELNGVKEAIDSILLDFSLEERVDVGFHDSFGDRLDEVWSGFNESIDTSTRIYHGDFGGNSLKVGIIFLGENHRLNTQSKKLFRGLDGDGESEYVTIFPAIVDYITYNLASVSRHYTYEIIPGAVLPVEIISK